MKHEDINPKEDTMESKFTVEQVEELLAAARESLRLAKGRRVQTAGPLASPARKAAQVERKQAVVDRLERMLVEARLGDGWAPVDRDDSPNPIIGTRPSSDGGTARLYLDGHVCAVDGVVYELSPGFDSFDELEAWIAEH